MKEGVDLIAAERARLMEVEYGTPQHDDEYNSDELAFSAAWYALPEKSRLYLDSFDMGFWPFKTVCFEGTPEDRIKELVKAGALIAAEIDRLTRRKYLDVCPFCKKTV